MDYEKVGRAIIKSNYYLTLATTDGKAPWIAPLFYAIDDKYNFYFISRTDSLHGRHILKNPNVAIAIFDSTQLPGTATGLQIEAKASLASLKDYTGIIRLFLKKAYKNETERTKHSGSWFDSLKKAFKQRIFKLEPKSFYMPDEECWQKHNVDRRKEVKLRD